MNSKLTKIIIILVVSGALISSVLLFYNSKRTHYNNENIVGNTAGNLYNGGLFSEYDGVIYFSNMSDDGALYRMNLDCTDVRKIHPNKVKYINVDKNYIYYSKVNYTKEKQAKGTLELRNAGVYRMDKNGKNLKMLNKDPAGIVSLYNNTLFFQHYDSKTGLTFYKVNIDNTDEKKLYDDPILPASYFDEEMYFAGARIDHEIHALNMNNLSLRTVYSGNAYMPTATKDWIYFISLDDNYRLCHIDLQGQEKEIVVDEFICTYNISSDGNQIFYQVDGGENNRIESIDLTTMKSTTIMEGDFKEIHITSNYMFFRDFKELNVYAYELKTGKLSTFHAPVIDK